MENNMDIPKDKPITGIANTESGGPIVKFEWKVDDVLQPNNTDTLTIPANTLSVGNHTIKFNGENYCGNISPELIEQINITEVTMVYTQTDSITVTYPTTAVTIKLRRMSTVTITVVDEKSIPVASAKVSIGTITGTTNTSGVAVLNNVPIGTQTVTTEIT
jgi:hypothetical protein